MSYYLIDVTPYYSGDKESYEITSYGKTEVNLKELLALIYGQVFWTDTDDRIWDELYHLVGGNEEEGKDYYGLYFDDIDEIWGKLLEYADVTENDLDKLLESKKLQKIIEGEQK